MKRNESIEKDALTEMMSPGVSPSAARDAEIREGVEMALHDFTPKREYKFFISIVLLFYFTY